MLWAMRRLQSAKGGGEKRLGLQQTLGVGVGMQAGPRPPLGLGEGMLGLVLGETLRLGALVDVETRLQELSGGRHHGQRGGGVRRGGVSRCEVSR